MNAAFQINLAIHASTELVAYGAFAHTVPFKNQSLALWNTAKMAPDRDLIEKKFMNCSLAEHRLTRTTDWQMKHKDTSEWRSASILKLVPIPLSSVPPPPQPCSPTPTTRLPFSSLSICLWICHYGNLTPGAEEEGAAFVQTNKLCRAHLWWFV